MPNPMNALADCGLDYQACGFKVAYEDQDRHHLRAMPTKYDRDKEEPLEPCLDCRNDPDLSCEIRNCAQEHSLFHCGGCPSFPCERITVFASDGMPHHAEAMANVERIKQGGEVVRLVEQEARYRCSCGLRTSRYVSTCFRCGATSSDARTQRLANGWNMTPGIVGISRSGLRGENGDRLVLGQ